MFEWHKIGAFALTEPEGGSDVAGGMRTTARREGDAWVLNGAKRWIGNGTFADLIVVWARDVADNQVKGFVLEKGTPGLTTTKIEGKIALRIVQNANVMLEEVKVPEANRLQRTSSWQDGPPVVLARTRDLVAWSALSISMRAYELAREYAVSRVQFGKPIGSYQMIQDLLVKTLGNVSSIFWIVVRLNQLIGEGRALPIRPRWPRRCAPPGCARWWPGAGAVRRQRHRAGLRDRQVVLRRRGDLLLRGTKQMNALIVG